MDARDEKSISQPVFSPQLTNKDPQFETTPFWEDNFDIEGAPDTSKWTFETGGSGWGNNELQYYTNGSNANVAGGNLIITARRESYSGMDYTSSRMITKDKGDFLYGRIEVRAKLPKGRGTWPAIWMLYSKNNYGGWPASGEIDIMEHVGFDEDNIHFSVHTAEFNHVKGTQKSTAKIVPGATENFHLYRLDWTPTAIRGFIDDVPYFEFLNNNTGFKTWPFDKKFFLILNIAVGGNWGGAQGVDTTVFPASMTVDYVRAFKLIN